MFDNAPALDCAGRALKLDRPWMRGILNLSGDSFSGDAVHNNIDTAIGKIYHAGNAYPGAIERTPCRGDVLRVDAYGSPTLSRCKRKTIASVPT